MKFGHSSLLVIKAFMDAPTVEFCGSDLMDLADVSPGVVYPFLTKWEDEGWLKSRWEEQDASKLGRPRKKLYKLTASGRGVAREVLAPFAVLRPVEGR